MLHLIKRRLTSPESALLLRDLFHKAYTPTEDSGAELVFGASIRRKNESVDEFLSYKTFMEEYLEFDIKKFFGLTLQDFFELTLYEKDALLTQATEHMKKLNEKMKQMKNEIGGDVSDLNLDNLDIGG